MNSKSTERAKHLVRRVWPLRLVVFLVLRPKRFLDEFIYSLIDYWRFRRSLRGFMAVASQSAGIERRSDRPGLLIVAGRAMNTQWCQLWAVLGGVYRRHGYTPLVLTSRNEPIRNLYFRLTGFQPIYIEDLKIPSVQLPTIVSEQIERLQGQ